MDILEDFRGWLHCDGHSAYDTYAKVKPDVTLLGCWMHCRRKFFDVTKTIKTEGLAHKAVKKIAKLYRIEYEINCFVIVLLEQRRLKSFIRLLKLQNIIKLSRTLTCVMF